ncbi:nitroreductase family protein [Dactylosporangium sp. NPDC000244]|uniref:Acg family FMN-binding oxidoreductase n=1 Tax=Dactylosporangium sp. NPDC000244 TaxID=3154365 RepID=UPI00332B5BD4
MSAHPSGPATTYQVGPVGRELARAAAAALHAPSVLNTQPWRWRIVHDAALLYADRRRRLATLDPTGRLLVLSCGAALHHACVTLAADGVEFEVYSQPHDDDPDLLAVVRYRGAAEPSPRVERMRRAIRSRRSDRRPFADRPVPDEVIERLCRAAQRTDARLQMVWARNLTDLAVAAGEAADAQLSDPRYRAELADWIRAPGEGCDGVPIDTLAPVGARPVPVRDFIAAGTAASISSRMDVTDRQARYGVVVTDGDGPLDWLTAGVTLSAVLLTATAEHLATSAMSDLVENEVARGTLRRMLGGVGYPAIGIRIGIPASAAALPRSPRRPAAEVVEVVADKVARPA